MGWLSNLWGGVKSTASKALNFGGSVLKRAGKFGGKVLRTAGDWAPIAGDVVSAAGLALGQPEVALAAQGVASVLHRAGAWADKFAPVADTVAGVGSSAQMLSSNLLTTP
jgi:hypothetical protein